MCKKVGRLEKGANNKMKTKTNNEAVNETITFFDKKVNNVIDVLYNNSLLNNLPEYIKLDKDTQKQITEDTINYYLTKIESLNMDDIEKNYYDIQEVTDYFSYSFNKKLTEKDKSRFNEVEDNGECIADDLIRKLFMKDDRKIKAPIKYDTLKQYCISNLLKDEDVDKAFLWIILKLSVAYNFIISKLTD